MSSASVINPLPEIILAGQVPSTLRNLIELAKPYHTVLLLYEDDMSDRLLAAWAETDRLNLKTRRIGELFSGIEVHTFGMDEFPAGTVIELNIRESGQDISRQNSHRTAYKSLLNELSLISVRNGRRPT